MAKEILVDWRLPTSEAFINDFINIFLPDISDVLKSRRVAVTDPVVNQIISGVIYVARFAMNIAAREKGIIFNQIKIGLDILKGKQGMQVQFIFTPLDDAGQPLLAGAERPTLTFPPDDEGLDLSRKIDKDTGPKNKFKMN
ncbi:MAG: hypothetical protein A3I89_02800 [Candidatus Harrisonbacteria bacterium RIFCSPLOWO2_02_FULL_41_11]|uniref:Uncharacterized protein n=1 Tax=Candidatus Harrisonbacteria bacterium RIFCSPHIGHO2_02_FULL_42_16 TaxID=1798404 RepID=A0A1G1ZJ44_9BACT|nr:MAG: hypothetical protein A3B92_00510 [Candidatus Harrisonbacteria bacterium RIFCSPHIGHO2_02_FULL_42_16]OGY66588.1 MAG: hypothetical protein A3I89_02800 [Candidatus Harrisonbacteria bacterium RIFCSPLOWO2_02_FULL_41_11]